MIGSLILAQILAGNIILRHLVRANFAFVGISGIFHALHHLGLERVSFLEQFVHAFRIRAFQVGQSLQISTGAKATVSTLSLLPRMRFLVAPAVFLPVAFGTPSILFNAAFFGATFVFASFFLGVRLFPGSFLANFFALAFFPNVALLPAILFNSRCFFLVFFLVAIRAVYHRLGLPGVGTHPKKRTARFSIVRVLVFPNVFKAVTIRQPVLTVAKESRKPFAGQPRP
jgi:hypothetical protein